MTRISWLPSRSIKHRLAVLTVGSIGLALSVCCVAFVVNDTITLRESMARQSMALAEVLASNSTTALSFRQDDIARELLQSMRNRPEIHSAWLLDDDGELFAAYARGSKFEGSAAEVTDGYRFTNDGFLEVAVAIEEAGERLGTMRLRVTTENVRRQILRNIFISGCVLIVSLAVGVLMSLPMQRSITRPILELATTAGEVSRDADYTRRVERTTDDEIGVLYEQFNSMLVHIQQANGELQQARDEMEQRVEERTRMLLQANEHLTAEMAARERTMQKLSETQRELIEASRKAGMADLADGVLHNIGNVLNSVNISASLVAEKTEQLRISGLKNSVSLLARQPNLADFFTHDDRGKRLPGYLAKLTDNLGDEQQRIVQELKQLLKNVNHIKEIVRAQQSYANVGGVLVECLPAELMIDALQFVEASLARHEIEVRREFADIAGFQGDRAKLLQILVNLIKNAKESTTASSDSVRGEITLRVEQRGERVAFQVGDNGVGIAPDALTRIFSHGFTTKATGHGFGLHSSANSAAEMGGAMSVHSDGPGTGATFTLELPLVPQRRTLDAVVANKSRIPPDAVSADYTPVLESTA